MLRLGHLGECRGQRGEPLEAKLLLEAGASQAKARAHQGGVDDTENGYFVGHQNGEEQRRAVDAMIAVQPTSAVKIEIVQ